MIPPDEHRKMVNTRNEQADAARYQMIERMVNGTEDGISIATGYRVLDPKRVLYWIRDEGGDWEAESTTLEDAIVQAFQMWEEHSEAEVEP